MATVIGDHDLCVTIEGLPYVVTTGDPAAAATAYAGTDFATGYDGLFVQFQHVSEIHPWDPFRGGGTCTLYFAKDSAGQDKVGIDMHKRDAGAKTVLRSGLDRILDTIDVKRSDDFPAAPFDFYIGNERLHATSKPDTNTIQCSAAEDGGRGNCAPFASGGDYAPYFSEHHRYGNYAYGVALEPIVSQYPQTWKGRWTALRWHTKTGGVLSAAASSPAVFAGTIAGGPRQDPDTGCTVVKLKHVMDKIRETQVFREQWFGKVTPGIKLIAGDTFTWSDFVNHAGAVTSKTANVLTVKVGAAGANEVEEGIYTADQIAAVINNWVASEKAATRLSGNYVCSISATDADGYRFRVAWKAGVAGDAVLFTFGMRARYASFLGLTQQGLLAGGTWEDSDSGMGATDIAYLGVRPPFHTTLSSTGQGGSGYDFDIPLDDSRGALIDQLAYLPSAAGGPGVDADFGSPGLSWGMFLVDNKILIRGGWSGIAPTTLQHVQIIEHLGGDDLPGPDFETYGHQYGVDDSPMEIRQVLYLEGPFGDMVKALFYSTGTATYNSNTWDTLGYGVGLGIPGELLGTTFENSVDTLPGADDTSLWIIKESTKVSELLSVDCVIRRCHVIFHQGHLKFVSWSTPSGTLATQTFDETNKAEPIGNKISQRSVIEADDQYATPILKIDYNRRLLDGQYYGHFSVTDLTAIDNLSGAAEGKTLQARNVFDDVGSGSTIEDRLAELLRWHPYFSQPFDREYRSITPPLYQTVAAGDLGTSTCPTARNPQTGRDTGYTGRPCLVLKQTWDPGGFMPGVGGGPPTKRAPVGTVDLGFPPLDRTTQYAPAAQFNGADYNAGLKKITCQAHEHSEASDPVDASRFADTYAIRIVEIDPPNPAAPLTYLRNVSGTPSGNDITHDGVALGTGGGETAFDTAKKYRVIFQGYTSSVAAQKSKCYQADDADGMISNVAQPYQYADYAVPSGYTHGHHYDLPERSANLSYGDGVPLDVGYERGLGRMCNNLQDHKTAYQAPMLTTVNSKSGLTPTSPTGRYLLFFFAVQLGSRSLPLNMGRNIYVRPWIRSSDGSAQECRVTLWKFRPTGSGAQFLNDPFPGTAVSFTWSTSSTTWAAGTEAGLDLKMVQRNTGRAWISIEGTAKLECRGLAKLIMREREMTTF